MTVEVRTDPPIAQLRVTGAITVALTADAFGERAGAEKQNAKIMSAFPQLDTSREPTPELMQAWDAQVLKFNIKHMNAVSIFITGLDEAVLARGITDFQDRIKAGQDVSGYFKGTRFGGKDKGSMNSVVAFLLKSAMPPTLSAKIGVKSHWEVQDVVRYAVAIREGLAKSGVAQPASGYTGASGGMLSGFGIFKVT